MKVSQGLPVGSKIPIGKILLQIGNRYGTTDELGVCRIGSGDKVISPLREHLDTAMLVLDPPLLLALAALTTSVSAIIWSLRRKP